MRKLLTLIAILLFTSLPVRSQISGAGQLSCSGATITGTAATSATVNNTVLASITATPAYGVLVQLDQTSTITGGVITFQVSYDNGTNFSTIPVAQVLNPSTGAQLTNPYTLVASTNQAFLIVLAGGSSFQIKLTTAISGTATVTPYYTGLCTQPTSGPLLPDSNGNLKVNISAQGLSKVLVTPDALPANQSINVAQVNGGTTSTAATGVQKVGVVGNTGATVDQAPGSATPTNAVMEGLSDGTNTRFALSDPTGRQLIRAYPDTTTTSYHASTSFAGSSTTDNSVFPGNATNTAILTKITVTCTQTTAGTVTLTLVKRSAADTGGTSATMTKVPDDANYTAAVSAPLTYTGTGPTVGTAVGNLDVAQFGCNASATAGPNDIYVFKPAKPIVLRGTAQQVAIGFGGAITGGTLTVTYDWMETTTP